MVAPKTRWVDVFGSTVRREHDKLMETRLENIRLREENMALRAELAQLKKDRGGTSPQPKRKSRNG